MLYGFLGSGTEVGKDLVSDLVPVAKDSAASVDIGAASFDLGSPCLLDFRRGKTAVQARGQFVDERLPILLRKLERGFQDFLRLQHVPSVARPAHDGVSFCTGPQLLEESGPTIAGGERSEPPVQSAGRGPGAPAPQFKMAIVAESAGGSAEAPASADEGAREARGVGWVGWRVPRSRRDGAVV